MPLDRNRPMTVCEGPNGERVSMYKDEPGVYYGEDGQPLSEAVAERAGFDVRSLARERQRREDERRRAEEEARRTEEGPL